MEPQVEAPSPGLTIGVTGHRPPRLGGYTAAVERRLATLAQQVLEQLRPARVLTGMAQGWDLAIAEACIRGEIPFTAALAHPEPDATWPAAQRERFAAVLGRAAQVHTQAPARAPGVHHARDRWIVERSDRLVALWDGTPSGGTYGAIRSARKRGVPVIEVWEQWVALDSTLR